MIDKNDEFRRKIVVMYVELSSMVIDSVPIDCRLRHCRVVVSRTVKNAVRTRNPVIVLV